MSNRDTDRPSDQEGQRGSNTEKVGNNRPTGRDTTPAPVPGSKEDVRPQKTREDLNGPLSGESERSGTHTDQ